MPSCALALIFPTRTDAPSLVHTTSPAHLLALTSLRRPAHTRPAVVLPTVPLHNHTDVHTPACSRACPAFPHPRARNANVVTTTPRRSQLHDRRGVVVTTHPHRRAHFTRTPPRPLSHPALVHAPSRGRHRSPSPSRTPRWPLPSPRFASCHPGMSTLPTLTLARDTHARPRTISGNYQIWSHPDFENGHMFFSFSSPSSLDPISFVCR
jgi:hypothetical protein